MTSATSPLDVRSSPWLVSPRFDLTWLFGGAALSLLAVVLTLGFGVSIVLLWWAWLLFFDGPHMMAAYSRTYLDRSLWRTRRLMLLGALTTFAIGPACLLVGRALGSDGPFLLFLAVATAYGYYHIVRQHYGFVALYKAKGGERSRTGFYLDKWCLYAGCGAPYLYFLVNHPRARAAMGLGAGSASPFVSHTLIAVWAASALVMVVVALRTPARERSLPKLAYALLAILMIGGSYFLVARYEPVYAASNGPDQDFLLLSIVITVIHNVQYVALVYVHNRSRYATAGAHGAASWASSTAARYLAVCLAFSAIYFLMARATGVFPLFHGPTDITLLGIGLDRVALATWWGLALHHYWLDQKIWRIKDDPDLRRHLGLG
jgi:hypothetical protein